MVRGIVLSAAAALIASSTAASAAVIDFNGFAEGDVLGDDTVLAPGIVADIRAIGGEELAVVFDTNPPSASTINDPDLASPFQNVDAPNDPFVDFGNALIVQERNVPNDPTIDGPDDEGRRNTTELLFDFETALNIAYVDLLDVEELTKIFINGETIAAAEGKVDNHGRRRTDPNTGALSGGSQNQFVRVVLNAMNVTQLRIDFGGSGAVGQFQATVVPLPATAPLLIAALGGAALLRRRLR